MALISHWEREKEVRGLSLLLKESTWQAEPWLICTPTLHSTELGPTQAPLILASRTPRWRRALQLPIDLSWLSPLEDAAGYGERGEGRREGGKADRLK